MSFLSDAVGEKIPKGLKQEQSRNIKSDKRNYQQANKKMNNVLMIKSYGCSSSHSLGAFNYLYVDNTSLVFMPFKPLNESHFHKVYNIKSLSE